MKFAIDFQSYAEALYYSHLSLDHTLDFRGWEDSHKKAERILCGQIAQNYLIQLLEINGLEISKDNSDYTQSDDFDFSWRGFRFDVKASYHPLIPMQVSTSAIKKAPHYYVFCRLYNNFRIIEVLGFVRAKEVIKPENFVPTGQLIPGTCLINRFADGSYFYTGEFTPLDHLIDYAKKQKEEAKIFS